MIASKRTNTKTLNSLIGKLSHFCYIFRPLHHFTGRLQALLYATDKLHHPSTIPTECILDLEFWASRVTSLRNGTSINNIVFRRPNATGYSDASTSHGLGGYWMDGHAWQYPLPPDC